VEPQGKILQTDAHYREGGRITVADFDANKAGAHLDRLVKVLNTPAHTPEERAALCRGVAGLKLEASPEVRVRFE
jgi:hypothetical protein